MCTIIQSLNGERRDGVQVRKGSIAERTGRKVVTIRNKLFHNEYNPAFSAGHYSLGLMYVAVLRRSFLAVRSDSYDCVNKCPLCFSDMKQERQTASIRSYKKKAPSCSSERTASHI